MLTTGNRRQFLKQIGLTAAGTLIAPAFLHAHDHSIPKFGGRRLVVIQLSGGNDGLNTVVPFRNDILYEARPQLLAKPSELLKVSDELAFNPAMEGFRSLFDEGDVCVLNSVGYPNPNRSHFRSMDIWHTASDAGKYSSTGWLGRYLDHECTANTNVTSIEIGQVLSLALKGAEFKGTPVANINQFYNASRKVAAGSYDGQNETASFLYKTVLDIKSTASYLYEKKKIYQSKKTYPKTKLGNDLKKIAEMIHSGVDSSIYYASLSGFDTHFNQEARQQRLLKVYSESLKTFVEDLKQSGEWKNTLVLTFSEFGRRVKQNASGGTDHGKANCLFLAGGALKKQGLYNDLPTLDHLDKGDLNHEIDFRQVYSTILDRWLSADAGKILGKKYEGLAFV